MIRHWMQEEEEEEEEAPPQEEPEEEEEEQRYRRFNSFNVWKETVHAKQPRMSEESEDLVFFGRQVLLQQGQSGKWLKAW